MSSRRTSAKAAAARVTLIALLALPATTGIADQAASVGVGGNPDVVTPTGKGGNPDVVTPAGRGGGPYVVTPTG